LFDRAISAVQLASIIRSTRKKQERIGLLLLFFCLRGFTGSRFSSGIRFGDPRLCDAKDFASVDGMYRLYFAVYG